MSNDINATKLPEGASSAESIVGDIQGMIGNLLQNTLNKMQKADVSGQIGADAPQADATADMGLADLKNFVLVMQKFIDNVNVMISGVESGNADPEGTDDKFLDGYMATADNVLEIAAFSMKDALTGLSNRYGIDSRMIYEWNRAYRDKTHLGLVIFSVSGFAGERDEVYKAVSKTLLKSVKRSSDFIARWDEDEFAALLPNTNASGVRIVAERILTELENTPNIETQGNKLAVSAGVCVHIPQPHEKPTELITKAHNAFKKAKTSEKSTIVYDVIDD